MVYKISCECKKRFDADIDSIKLFEEIKEFFKSQVKIGVYEEISVQQPYYIGESALQTIQWYADKWYKCKVCGCLWELVYPDFPAHGFVRKLEDGIYRIKE